MPHPSAAPGSNVNVNPWIVALTVSIATFMEVMDTSIANVSLRHIAGSLSAGQSESTWVLTSYLVSNAIILPISGWLASVMGRKRFYMTCVATVHGQLIFVRHRADHCRGYYFFACCRASAAADSRRASNPFWQTHSPSDIRGQAFALYGMAVVLAPAIGPSLGGWITDNYNWRWIFFINVPVGILSLFLTYSIVQDSKAAKKETKSIWRGGLKIDYIGFGLVALGLGCLQIILDKGQEDDWFGSYFIIVMAILSVVGIAGLIIRELSIKNPIVDLRLFSNTHFLITNLVMFATFFVLLSTTQLLPQFVQQLLHYDATKAGLILMPGGFVIMLLMPIVGRLVNVVQPKYLIGVGLLVMAGAMQHMTNFDTQASFKSLAISVWVVTMKLRPVRIDENPRMKMPSSAGNRVAGVLRL